MFKFALLVLIAVSLGQLVVQEGQSSMTVSYKNLTIDVRLTGVPRFSLSNGQETNRIIFSKIYQTQYESNYKQKLGGTNVALASMNWVVSKPLLTNNNTQVEFNFTGKTNSNPWTLVFRNKITTEKAELKFDTMFFNFEKEWHKDAGYLVLSYKLQNKEVNPTKKQQNGNKVNFDNAFFSVEPKANAGTKKVVTVLSEDEEDQNSSTVFLLYEKFGNSLIHDPTLGVEAYPQEGNVVYVVVAIVVVVVVAAFFALGVVIGGLFYYFRKEAGFQSL